jgi:hypothetical protein
MLWFQKEITQKTVQSNNIILKLSKIFYGVPSSDTHAGPVIIRKLLSTFNIRRGKIAIQETSLKTHMMLPQPTASYKMFL